MRSRHGIKTNSSASGEAGPPTKVYVHLRQGLDVEAYRRRYEAGIEPDASPYGFHLASDIGFDVTFPDDGPADGMIRGVVRKTMRKLLGFDIFHALRNRKAMARADVIWTMLEPEALAIAALMRLGLLDRKPLIAATVWMINRWYSYGLIRRWFLRSLTSYWPVMTVHAQPCLDRARIVLPKTKAQLMYFGVSTDTFSGTPNSIAQNEPIHVVAVGGDRTRDWDILLAAFGGDPRFQLTIVCRWLDKQLAQTYENVSIVTEISMDEFRTLYKCATYVAVTMKENIFSGITVALEAVALGAPLLSSRTGGVPTYFSEDEALYVPVGNAVVVREAVLAQSVKERHEMAKRAFERFQRCDYSTRGMISRYAMLTHELMTDSDQGDHE